MNQQAFNFTLKNSENREVSLSDYKGKRVMLVFYPKDGSPVCTKQLCEYSMNLNEFNDLGVTVLGISTDTIAKHREFKKKNNINFELLSDVERLVCRKYRMLNFLGVAKRGIFLIDENGIIKVSDVTIPLNYQKKDYLKKIIARAFK